MKRIAYSNHYVRWILLVLTLLFAGSNLQAEVTTGTCGEHLNWSYDSDTKTLTFSGYGDMTDKSGWSDYKSNIEIIESECSGEFTVSDSAFYNYSNLKKVSLPNADTIGTRAFYGCEKLDTFLIGGGDKGYWGDGIFENCSNLKHLVVLNTAAPTISSLGASDFTLYYPANLAESYTQWSEADSRVELTYHEADETTYKVNGWYSEDNSIYVTDDYKLIITHKYINGFCSKCGAYEPANKNSDDVYEISNAGQLYWFANLVNTGISNANATLTDNIVVNDTTGWNSWNSETTGLRNWMPIGNETTSYTGTFNGNGHTISGLYCSLSSDYVGLFGAISKTTVANVGLEKAYIHGGNMVGSICGHCEGTINGDNLDGGIVNCYNTGNVDGADNVGGICGYSSNANLTNCFNTGSVSSESATNLGAICGTYDNNSVYSTNCYYLNGTDVSETANAKTADQFASGEVAILLQKYVDESGDATLVDWTQVIGDANSTFGKGGIQYMREKKSNKWGTLCLPYAISETNATLFYTIEEIDDDVLVLNEMEIEEGKVDAGVPVIYYCAEDTLMILVQDFGNPSYPKNDGLLKGVYEQTTVIGINTYYQEDDTFYICNDSFMVNTFMAYIKLPSADNAPLTLNIDKNDEDITGVDKVINNGLVADIHIDAIYNIKGQRVSDMEKGGIYMVKMSDGSTKKVRIK